MNTTQLLERPAETDVSGPPVPPPLVDATKQGGARYHVGRSWDGPGPLENCPCHKAECGLVDDVDEFCTEHGPVFAQTMRARHHERDCKGAAHFPLLRRST